MTPLSCEIRSPSAWWLSIWRQQKRSASRRAGEVAQALGVDEVGMLLAPEERQAAEVARDGGFGDAQPDGDGGPG